MKKKKMGRRKEENKERQGPLGKVPSPEFSTVHSGDASTEGWVTDTLS